MYFCSVENVKTLCFRALKNRFKYKRLGTLKQAI